MRLRVFVVLCAISMAGALPCCAQGSERRTVSSGADWEVQAFVIGWGPLPWSSDTLVDPANPFPAAPVLAEDVRKLERPPAEDAGEAAWVEHIRLTTAACLRGGMLSEAELPAGSAFWFEPSSRLLVVRTTAEKMDLIKALYDQGPVPHYVHFQLHVVQAAAADVRQLLADTQHSVSHANQWRQVEEMIRAGKAKSLGTLALQTRSGQRAKVASESSRRLVTAFTIDGKGAVLPIEEAEPDGLRFEIDPVLSEDDQVFDCNCGMSYGFAPPRDRKVPVGIFPPAGRVEMVVTDIRRATFSTALSFRDGAPRLLAAWKPFGRADAEREDVLQMAFVRGEIVKNESPVNTAVVERFKALVEKAVPIPVGKAKGGAAPDPAAQGMKAATFDAPADFLRSGASQQAAVGSPPMSPKERVRSATTARSMLERAGVAFPAGASAIWDESNHTVIVTNTQANLASAEAFFGGFTRCWSPRIITSTLNIVQAEGSVLRPLLEEQGSQADAATLWKKLQELASQGRAKVVIAQRLDGRSGWRSEIDAVEDHRFLSGLAAKGKDRVAGSVETRAVGLHWVLAPVIGPDGVTMDFATEVAYDYAPPSSALDMAGATVAKPIFHSGSLNVSGVMSAGMTRLLGVWKPEGTEEFDGGDILQAVFMRSDIVRVEN